MRYDMHFRSDVIAGIQEVVGDIKKWNCEGAAAKNEIEELEQYVTPFEHCAVPDHPFLAGGADGSGDFPCVAYGDSFVYLVYAMARLYEASTDGRMRERAVSNCDMPHFLWLPEDKKLSNQRFLEGFARMMGESPAEICRKSDYYALKKQKGKAPADPAGLIDTLILPEAHDANNIGIQLLSVAEAGSLIRLMKSEELKQQEPGPVYLMEDTTLALPMVTAKSTLFFEIVKRYACTVALENNFVYLTLSKSHNMPRMDLIEDMVERKVPGGEHWFLRIPAESTGQSKPDFLGTRTIPPKGAVSYLFRLHKTTQTMRLDMDINYWNAHIRSCKKEEERAREIQLFRDLDFASHDQRCYGYPYPIKSCHDMVSMREEERIAMRKQLIDAAVKAGLKRKNFIDPGTLTGHG